MGSLSDFAENSLINHLLTATTYTPAATLYLALCTADPTDAATGASMNECANSGTYGRTAIAFAAAASRSIAQTGAVTFPTASGSWGTVSHWAIVDTNTYGSGNVLASGAFGASKAVASGNTPSVATGQITVSFNAAGASDYLANKFLDFMFRNQAFTRPSTYVALTTATISDGLTGATITEVANSGAYARHQITAWSAASGGASHNTGLEAFTAASGSWGTVVAACLVDSGTYGAGNLLVYDNSVADQAVASGDTYQFAANTGFVVTLT